MVVLPLEHFQSKHKRAAATETGGRQQKITLYIQILLAGNPSNPAPKPQPRQRLNKLWPYALWPV